ncbi:FAD-linked oxidase [Bacillus cereus]|nr:FAD-linked oxidase [Bacillus sp. AY1-10]KAB7637752.1 FAD-linked oxidase [Bacillus sp. B3-WWTP-C-10-D-3]MDR4321430.1 FAD-linked oxidase [Bacillus paranthracis]MDR4406404.1 FAD-linked oxidase [Bacillus anthracis]OPA03985.1 FAD-linked oxidase [Bacillus cereus]TEA47758.1 FAD-linked oxidase [Bacillus sp. BH2]TNO94717.1 FAD-linked oxidase [Bacillus sp. CD3-1a]
MVYPFTYEKEGYKRENYRNYDVRFLIEMVYDVRVAGQEQLRNEICLCEK